MGQIHQIYDTWPVFYETGVILSSVCTAWGTIYQMGCIASIPWHAMVEV